MTMNKLSLLSILCVSALLNACDNEAKPPLVASDIVIYAALPGKSMSAGYLSLTNNTNERVSLTNVSSPEFGSVEIHETLLEDGVAKMRRISELSIPARTTVTLERGGKHLMLMRPTSAASEIKLSFHSGDTVLLSVQIPLTVRKN